MARYKRDTKVNNLLITEKSYRVIYRINGRKRELTIGSKDIPINVIRNKAQQILGEVARGIDPLSNKKSETLNDVFQERLEDLYNRGKKCVKKNADGDFVGELVRVWNYDVKKTLGRETLISIETGDITRLHRDISKRARYQANRVVQEIKATFELAIALSYTRFNPAKYVPVNAENIRNRPITDKELAELNRQINIREAKIHPRHINSIKYIRLVLLTGARCVSELGNAKWSDLHENKLVLQNHKTDYKGKDRVIQLSKQAMAIINSIDKKDDYILGVKYPFRTWKAIRDAAGCPDLQFKDLRHNFGTLGGEIEKLEDVSGMMGHSSTRTTERYRKLRDQKAAQYNQEISDYMTKIMMSN